MDPKEVATLALEWVDWLIELLGRDKVYDLLSEDAIKRANAEVDVLEAVKLGLK